MAPRRIPLNPLTPAQKNLRKANELIRCLKNNEKIAALAARGIIEATALGGTGYGWRLRNPHDPTMVAVTFVSLTNEVFQGGRKIKKLRGLSFALKTIGVEFTE